MYKDQQRSRKADNYYLLLLLTLSQLFLFLDASASDHKLILAGSGMNRIVMIDKNTGQTEWIHPLEKGMECNSVSVTSKGEILFSYGKGVRLIDINHQTIWDYNVPKGSEIHSASVLPDGGFLLAWSGKPAVIVELDSDGHERKHIVFDGKNDNTHSQFRQIMKTKEEKYIVPLMGEKEIIEISSNGNIRVVCKLEDSPFSVTQKINSPHWVVSCGDGHKLLEIEPKTGKIIKKIGANDLLINQDMHYVAQIVQLWEGTMDYIVCNWNGHFSKKDKDRKIPHILQVDKYNNVVWKYDNFDDVSHVSAVAYVYDVNLFPFKNLSQNRDILAQLKFMDIKAIELSLNDMKKQKGFDSSKYDVKLDELKRLIKTGFPNAIEGDDVVIARVKKALQLKREILLANPLLDFDKIILARYKHGNNARNIMAESLGSPFFNWTCQTFSIKNLDAEIAELSDLRGECRVKTLFKPKDSTSIVDFKMNFDGDRFMFSMLEPGDHHFQIYELNVDGSGLKQLTHGSKEDLDFFDGCYLPNGKIMAVSNLAGQGVPCDNGNSEVGNLCIYDPEDHSSLRRVTFEQDQNWSPVVLSNGRVMYIRWEYTDLTHYFSRIVMHMNPDGTEQRSLYGSGTVFPNSVYDIMPLPDSPIQFVGVASGHHGVARSGRLMIFDPSKSRKGVDGIIQELPYKDREIIPLVKDSMVNNVWPQFLKPIPLSNHYFLVSAKLTPQSLWGIYLVDIHNNLTLIKEIEGEGLVYNLPIVKGKRPPIIPDKVDMKNTESTVFIQDLYEGEGLDGVPRGTVKALRVFAYEYAYMNSASNHTAQGIQSGWDMKRLLGTVPVEEDGSVIFKIPANTPVSLQPLDSEGRAIQWMRSWIVGMPGEIVSCVGCHEDQNSIPIPKKVIASSIIPHKLTTPEGGIRSFSFDLEIQPILDRNCISCHDEDAKLNYKGGRKHELGYSKSYLDFHPYIHRQGPEAGMKVLYPYEYHVSNSQMVRMLKNGHYGVKLSDKEWKRLYTWIDLNAPDKGTFESKPYHGCDLYNRRIDINNRYANGTGIDWRQEIKDYTDYLKQQPKGIPYDKGSYKAPTFKSVSVKDFPFVVKNQPERKEIELGNGIKIAFVRIPTGSFVMGKNIPNSDCSPAHKATVNKSFWMSEKEISNELMKLFVPSHDSRFVDQQWKDHVSEGYPAYFNNMSASRVSYSEAEEFCNLISKHTGLNVLLPTEVQWEWACRAGSAADYWYGDKNVDFGNFENMADIQTLNLAVWGVDPVPMWHKSEWFPLFSWLPKNENVDDGQMIVCESGLYQANPFGLYDMHGNVAEWTRSTYFSYPYKEKKQESSSKLPNAKRLEKVVRGGSWKDHPKYSSSFYRKAFLPYQKPYNVGFRVIIEE